MNLEWGNATVVALSPFHALLVVFHTFTLSRLHPLRGSAFRLANFKPDHVASMAQTL
jgi:hypothetical protein